MCVWWVGGWGCVVWGVGVGGGVWGGGGGSVGCVRGAGGEVGEGVEGGVGWRVVLFMWDVVC